MLFRSVLKESNVGWYVVIVLGLLGLVDTLQGYAFGVMAPEISRALGVTRSELATLNAVKTLATAALTMPRGATQPSSSFSRPSRGRPTEATCGEANTACGTNRWSDSIGRSGCSRL